jgi:hypothetical protein
MKRKHPDHPLEGAQRVERLCAPQASAEGPNQRGEPGGEEPVQDGHAQSAGASFRVIPEF